jgi:hypothetical protein
MPNCFDNLGRQYFLQSGNCPGYSPAGTIAGIGSQFSPTQGGTFGQAAVQHLPGATGNYTNASPGAQLGTALSSSNPGAVVASAIGNPFAALLDPNFLKRVGLLSAAFVAIILGVILWAKGGEGKQPIDINTGEPA